MPPKVINVPGVGFVRFPETTPQEVIARAIETSKLQIPNTHSQQQTKTQLPIPNTHGRQTVGNMGTVPHPAIQKNGQTLKDILSQVGDLGNETLKLLGLEPFGPQDPNALATIDAEQPFGHAEADAPGQRLPSGARFGTEMPLEIGMIVHHGTPHLFDEFSAAKIGTGEGAQVYGHGLYFAQNPEVSAAYKTAGLAEHEALAKITLKDGTKLPTHWYHLTKATSGDPVRRLAINMIQQTGTVDDAIRTLGKTIRGGTQAYDQHLAALETLRGEIASIEKPGHMYTADIPDRHIANMLDLDEPISKQSPEIQKAVNKIIAETEVFRAVPAGDGTTMNIVDQYGNVIERKVPPEHAADSIKNYLSGYWGENAWGENEGALAITGKAVQDRLHQAVRAKISEQAAAAKVSKILEDAGIPGVKYADQMSRISENTAWARRARDIRRFVEAEGGDIGKGVDRYIEANHGSEHPLFKGAVREQYIKEYKPPTRNFVVFDPRIIDSVHRNGVRVYSKAGVFAAMPEPTP